MPNLPSGLLVRGPRCIGSVRYGLLSVVDPVTPTDQHWEGSGVEWEDFLCATQSQSFLDYCPPVSGFTKTATSDIDFCHADPFYVKGSFECSTGGRPVSEGFEIARQRLLTWENHEVERTFWTGISANGTVNPSLAFGNDTCGLTVTDLTPLAGAVDPTAAISILEEALTDFSACGGVIHAPYGFAAQLAQATLLEREGDRYYTPTGQSLALGAGYPGTGPANVAPGAAESWLFATGPIAIWRSNVFMTPNDVAEGVNRSVNNITVHAERAYAVGFSCPVIAVRARRCSFCV